MAFRVSLQYQMQAELLGGWTENFWNETDQLTIIEARARELGRLSDRMHGDQSQLKNIRISDATLPTQTFRDVMNIPLDYPPDVATDTGTQSDYFTTAGLVKMVGVGNYVVRQWFRALADNVVRKGGKYNPTTAFTTLFNQFKAELLLNGNNWRLRVNNRATPVQAVESITQLGVVTVTGHGYSSGNKVRLMRVVNPKTANKLYRIVVLSSSTFQLVGWVDPGIVPIIGISTAVQKPTPIYVPIQTVEIVRATSHRTGRPLGLLGGRRRIRR